jgi:Flp pilus assembly protein TadG
MIRVRKPDRQRGAAAVELALLIPLILALLLGTWETGRLIEVNQILDNAAREGARQASTGQLTNSQVQQVVVNYLQHAGLPTQNVVVTVTNLTAPGTDALNATQLDQLQVHVRIPFSDVRWSALSLFAGASTQINAEATWFCLKDQNYPTTVTSPAGF